MKSINLFDFSANLLQRVLESMSDTLNKNTQPGEFPIRPTQGELLEQLRKLGFITAHEFSFVLPPLGVGMEPTPLQCGDVVFMLFDNWNINTDGMNRNQALVPFCKISGTKRNLIMPFASMQEYEDPDVVLSVYQDSLNSVIYNL
jgi:hypothetical protein